MRRIKVEKLTPEAFKEFGTVFSTVGRDHESTPGVYDWYPGQGFVDNAESVSVNLLTVKEREFWCQKFERHEQTSENLIPITAGLVISCLPAGPVCFERLRAFYVPVGMGVSFAPNVWHFAPHPIGCDATCVVVFANGTSQNDMIFDELPEPVGFEL